MMITIDPVRPGAAPSGVQPSNPKSFPKPVPYYQWPIWAKGLKWFSTPADKGIGDTVARMIGDENSEAFKAWYESTFGKKCGCTGRRIRWNIEFPLK